MKQIKRNKYLIIAAALVLFGFSARLFDHPANFAPIAAMALFSGVYLPRKFAFIVPALAMFLSDLFIGFYQWQIMLTVYGSFLLAGLIGLYLRKNKKIGAVIAGSLAASILFFLITNFTVWFFYYERSWAGLYLAYTLAIPFFRNTMLGDLFFTGVLFGSYELVYWLAREKFNRTVQKEYLRS